MRSHYDELGIEQTATQEQILEAYRYLALRFHPDLNKGKEDEAERRFIRIQAAFDVLSSPERRLRYDCDLLSSLRKVIVVTEPELAHATAAPPPWPSIATSVEPLDLDFRVKTWQKRPKRKSISLAVWFLAACVFASGFIIYFAVQHMKSNGIHSASEGEK
jgi:curved DNA-binding protein CbpA